MQKLFLAIATFITLFGYSQDKQETKASVSRTLSIIKPDAVRAKYIGEIIARVEKVGLKVIAAKMTELSKQQAEEFYGVHKDRPFFKDLVSYMQSGPIMVLVLEGQDAVQTYRKLMGATNPQSAEKGTLRRDFGSNVQSNAVHGSDSVEAAGKEIAFFFSREEVFSY